MGAHTLYVQERDTTGSWSASGTRAVAIESCNTVLSWGRNLNGQLGAQTILTNDAKVEIATANKIIAADKDELVATVKADNAACVASTKIAVDAEAKKGRKRTFWSVLATVAGMAIWLK